MTATESEHLDRLIAVLVATSHYHSSSISPQQIGVGEMVPSLRLPHSHMLEQIPKHTFLTSITITFHHQHPM